MAQIAAGQITKHRQTGTGGQQYRRKPLHKNLIDHHGAAKNHIRLDFDTQGFSVGKTAHQHFLRQAEFRDRITQKPAGLMRRFKNSDAEIHLG